VLLHMVLETVITLSSPSTHPECEGFIFDLLDTNDDCGRSDC
jgi:hypothetical protein